jgi:hypothetical protein
MAGLIAGGDKKKLSMPFYGNVLIKGIHDAVPDPAPSDPSRPPIYADLTGTK